MILVIYIELIFNIVDSWMNLSMC